MTDVSLHQPGAAMTRRQNIRRWMREPITSICILFVVLQVACVIGALGYPDDFRYLSGTNVALLMRAIPILGITSLGVGLLMISGEFDLSVGSVYTLAGYVIALLYGAGFPLWAAFAATLAVGLLIGLGNGLLTLKTGIPSFIATMGTMMVVRGLVRFLSEGRTVSFKPPGLFMSLFTGEVAGIEAPFIWFIGLAIAAGVLLHRSKLGNHMFLVGGNERTARAVGINTHFVKIVGFMLSAVATSFAGIISITRVGTATPAQGIGMELRAVAVCVIGGVFLSGGRGTVLGIVVGACLMYMVEDVLLLLRAPGFYLDVFVGAILVFAVIANTWLTRRTAR